MNNKVNVLITGAGAPGAFGLIKMLRKSSEVNKVFGVDIKSIVSNIYFLDEFRQIMQPSNPKYLQNLLKIAVEKKVDLIIPIVTKELEILSNNKELFKEKGIELLVSDPKILSKANNKKLMLETLKNNTVRVPKYFAVNSVDDLIDSSKKLGFPKKTICFKPSVSNGSRGFRIIDQNIDKLDLLFNHKPNSTYITMNEVIDILGTNEFPELLVMQYLPDEEYSIDVFAENGNVIIAVPRLRLEVKEGISVKNKLIYDEILVDYCRSIVRALDYDGFLGIQIKYSNGKPYILEINPRIQGSTVTSLATGINFADIMIKRSLGKDFKLPKIQWGKTMIRYWEEVYFDDRGHAFTL